MTLLSREGSGANAAIALLMAGKGRHYGSLIDDRY
jgi:hypothetical protein